MPDFNRWELEVSTALNTLTETPGDEAAWTVIYERMWSFVVAACYRYLGTHRDQCEDAAQAVFFKLLEKPTFPKFEHGLPQFKRFLDVTSKHLCLDWARQSRRREARERLSGAREQSANAPPGIEDSALLNEMIQKLTADERSLLDALLAGRTLAEIANRFGISISSVHRRREALKTRLGELGVYRGS